MTDCEIKDKPIQVPGNAVVICPNCLNIWVVNTYDLDNIDGHIGCHKVSKLDEYRHFLLLLNDYKYDCEPVYVPESKVFMQIKQKVL